MFVSGIIGRCLVQVAQVIERQTKLWLLQLGEFVLDRETAASFCRLHDFRWPDRIFFARYFARLLIKLELLASIIAADNTRPDPVILLTGDFSFLDILRNDETYVSLNQKVVSRVFNPQRQPASPIPVLP